MNTVSGSGRASGSCGSRGNRPLLGGLGSLGYSGDSHRSHSSATAEIEMKRIKPEDATAGASGHFSNGRIHHPSPVTQRTGHLLCQRARTPVGGILRLCLQSQGHDSLDCAVADLPWRSRPRLVDKPIQTALDKAAPPASHGLPRDTQPLAPPRRCPHIQRRSERFEHATPAPGPLSVVASTTRACPVAPNSH